MKIAIVLVIYNQLIEQSPSYQSVVSYQSKVPDNQLELIIYDNSLAAQSFDSPIDDFSIKYVHDSRNIGISAAYQYALEHTENEWLLLLDQDTVLPTAYFNELFEKIGNVPTECVAIVPQVIANGERVSPADNQTFNLNSQNLVAGVQKATVTGINSGACFKTGWLKEIGGFNQEFPLDYLDHWLYYAVYQSGNYIYLMDTAIEHDLSVMDYNSISLNRYISIAESEKHYFQKYKKEHYQEYRKHLKKRLLKQTLLVKNKQIMRYTLKMLKNK